MEEKKEDRTGKKSVIILYRDGERIEMSVLEFLKELEAMKHG